MKVVAQEASESTPRRRRTTWNDIFCSLAQGPSKGKATEVLGFPAGFLLFHQEDNISPKPHP